MLTMSPQVVRSRLADQFGEKLRLLLDKREMSQKDLAEACGISENGISKLLNGTRQIRFDTIEQISKALQVAPSSLFPDQ